MADIATVPKKKKQSKLRVIEPNAPKALRREARKVTVVAVEKGYYNHRRVRPGTTFTMLLIGDESLPLPLWVKYPDDPEAVELLHELEEANRPRHLPAGVSASKATRAEDLALSRVRRSVEEDDDDDDDDDESDEGVGGGGGRSGSSVI